MNIKTEIETYISANENNGVLLLTGKWGCGKTYLIKNISKEINLKNEFLMVHISLFGIDSIDILHKTIKETVFFEKDFEEKGENVKSHLSKIKNVVQKFSETFSDNSKVAKGINTALSISWQDFFQIKKEIECYHNNKKHKKKLVLIFDDFERIRKLDNIELMGAINEYSENREIKIILIADEEHIKNGEYTEFKEKLISRTIKLVPDYDSVISSIINNYNESAVGYRDFLLQNINIIQNLFAESKTENLRSLRAWLLDFERVYSAGNKTDVSKKYQPNVLYMFGAVLFSVKNGDYKEDDLYGDIASTSKLSKKYKKWESIYKLNSLKNWIVSGKWDEVDFISEINAKFNITDMTDDQKFIRYIFWDLDQNIIDNGMPTAINKAYNGELCCDDIIGLLQKINAMKKYKIPLPCNVDYSQISAGFEKRKQEIISLKIDEPKRHSFSEKHQIEDEAYPLYQKIERLDNELITIKNKQYLIDYLKNSKKPSHHFEGMVIGSLDEKLTNLFFEKYCSANNAKKRDLARLIIELGLSDKLFTTSEDTKITLKNLSMLKTKLEKYKTDINDYITITNINEFIKKIETRITNLSNESKEEAQIH